MQIKSQHEQGVYIRDIAEGLGVHPRTVSRALKRGAAPAGKRPAARVSKLDAHKDFVDSELAAGVWNAQVIYAKLAERGYEGGMTVLRNYIRPKRPMRASRATVRYETEPGAQMQSDWGQQRVRMAGQAATVHFCVNVLGYSRRFHLFISESADANHTYEAQKRAFEHFGGAAREVLVDNQKAAVVAHRPGQGAVFNPGFVDFCSHYGTRPRACRPMRARTKGKVERLVRYAKENFFARYPEAESLAHYNQLAEAWLAEVADRRIHGTTGEVVAERFARELGCLLPLPPVPFDTSYREERQVAWDGFIDVRGNRYPVPDHLLGKRVQVAIGLDGVIKAYDAGELVAVHSRRDPALGWAACPAYHSRLWAQVAAGVERRPLAAYEEVSA